MDDRPSKTLQLLFANSNLSTNYKYPMSEAIWSAIVTCDRVAEALCTVRTGLVLQWVFLRTLTVATIAVIGIAAPATWPNLVTNGGTDRQRHGGSEAHTVTVIPRCRKWSGTDVWSRVVQA